MVGDELRNPEREFPQFWLLFLRNIDNASHRTLQINEIIVLKRHKGNIIGSFEILQLLYSRFEGDEHPGFESTHSAMS